MIAWILLGVATGLTFYVVAGYPLLLRICRPLMSRSSVIPQEARAVPPGPVLADLYHVTVCVVVRNGRGMIEGCIRAILASDWPPQLLEVVVVSDASDDGTDEAVRALDDPRVRLVRMPVRGGKTQAENAVASSLGGQIIVNTDASVRLAPGAIRALCEAFSDPSVGAASGVDLSAEKGRDDDSRYVGFEMWLRTLETASGGIVGNSGSIYAIRSDLHGRAIPGHLSRDLASALVVHEAGLRSVLVPGATCIVPGSRSLRVENRRKIRTAMRGMQTLHYFRHQLAIHREGWFAFKLWSHKVARWALPPLLFALGPVLLLSAAQNGWSPGWTAASAAWVGVFGVFGMVFVLEEKVRFPRWALALAYFGMAIIAGTVACVQALLPPGDGHWEPTPRREGATGGV